MIEISFFIEEALWKIENNKEAIVFTNLSSKYFRFLYT